MLVGNLQAYVILTVSVSPCINALKPSSNCRPVYHLLEFSITLYFAAHKTYLWVSYTLHKYNSYFLNSIKQLIFVMELRCVFLV